MKRSDLLYDLPADRIAQRPCEPRDAARMLVLHRKEGRIEDRTMRELPEFLHAGDCLIVNKTRVLPARFVGKRASGGRVEGLFVREPAPGRWIVMLKGIRRLKPGEAIQLGEGRHSLTVLNRLERGLCEVRLNPPAPAAAILEEIGTMPLPPYIHRGEKASGQGSAGDPASDDLGDLAAMDRDRYQTIYASAPGAVAAPTAGLHFTPELLDRIRAGGVKTIDVILHVGLGTFQPVEVDDLADHAMHEEWYDMPQATVDAVSSARAAGGRCVAVGTTSVRVLETSAQEGQLMAGAGWTNLLIYPPYEFRAVDALLTNFHLPGSTLIALVCAFAGRDLIMRAYRHAIENGYRFYSYGDAMLVV